jgi:hypothetical protein
MRCLATHLFSMALGAVVAGVTLPGLAQQAEKPYRIGILSLADRSSTKIFDAFREALPIGPAILLAPSIQPCLSRGRR